MVARSSWLRLARNSLDLIDEIPKEKMEIESKRNFFKLFLKVAQKGVKAQGDQDMILPEVKSFIKEGIPTKVLKKHPAVLPKGKKMNLLLKFHWQWEAVVSTEISEEYKKKLEYPRKVVYPYYCSEEKDAEEKDATIKNIDSYAHLKAVMRHEEGNHAGISDAKIIFGGGYILELIRKFHSHLSEQASHISPVQGQVLSPVLPPSNYYEDSEVEEIVDNYFQD